MSLVNQYKRQFKRRSWSSALDALPELRDHVVLDLGCAVGDLTAEFVTRGAQVVGVDMNEDLFARFMNEPEFQDLIAEELGRKVYEKLLKP